MRIMHAPRQPGKGVGILCGSPHYPAGGVVASMVPMPTFIAETFVPQTRADEVEAATERLSRLDRPADGPSAGPTVRYVRSTFVPGDEVCFHIFEADSADDVVRVASDLGVRLDRVAEAREGFG